MGRSELMNDWASPFWEHVGLFGVIAFAVLIALVLVARYWLAGRNPKLAERSTQIIKNVGGSRAGREAVERLSHK
jgi:hypothetical protein